jgi:hypothetical protein
LPFIRLRDLFEVSDPPVARENIVVVRHAGQKTGLVVDTLFGEFQTVIKPLGKLDVVGGTDDHFDLTKHRERKGHGRDGDEGVPRCE